LLSKDLIIAASRAIEFMDRENYLPTSVSVGDYANLSPEDFLASAWKLLGDVLAGTLPEKISVSKGTTPNLKYVHPAAFRRACKWTVLPPKFKGQKLLEQIKLQAWTLRPALPPD